MGVGNTAAGGVALGSSVGVMVGRATVAVTMTVCGTLSMMTVGVGTQADRDATTQDNRSALKRLILTISNPSLSEPL